MIWDWRKNSACLYGVGFGWFRLEGDVMNMRYPNGMNRYSDYYMGLQGLAIYMIFPWIAGLKILIQDPPLFTTISQ